MTEVIEITPVTLLEIFKGFPTVAISTLWNGADMANPSFICMTLLQGNSAVHLMHESYPMPGKAPDVQNMLCYVMPVNDAQVAAGLIKLCGNIDPLICPPLDPAPNSQKYKLTKLALYGSNPTEIAV